MVLDHNDAKFDYPIHCHAEYEINLVLHSDGTHIIGTRQEPFSGMDLIIIAPFVPHVWKAREEGNRVVTVQFSGKMTEFQMMGLRQFRHISFHTGMLNGQTALATGEFPMWVSQADKYVDDGILFGRYRKGQVTK